MAKCPGFWLLDDREGSSPAADTGTAVGRAIELYHSSKASVEEILEKVEQEAPDAERPFDQARWDEVRKRFPAYAQDPRNPRDAVPSWSLELPVSLVLDDLNGEPIYFSGHLDQVRWKGDVLEVWDVKDGKPGGVEMVRSYSWQQSFYALALVNWLADDENLKKLDREPIRVAWGGIIRTRGYFSRKKYPPGEERVFFRSGFNNDDLSTVADMVRRMVTRLRDLQVDLRPGDSCNWCPGEDITSCVQLIKGKGYRV